MYCYVHLCTYVQFVLNGQVGGRVGRRAPACKQPRAVFRHPPWTLPRSALVRSAAVAGSVAVLVLAADPAFLRPAGFANVGEPRETAGGQTHETLCQWPRRVPERISEHGLIDCHYMFLGFAEVFVFQKLSSQIGVEAQRVSYLLLHPDATHM